MSRAWWTPGVYRESLIAGAQSLVAEHWPVCGRCPECGTEICSTLMAACRYLALKNADFPPLPDGIHVDLGSLFKNL